MDEDIMEHDGLKETNSDSEPEIKGENNLNQDSDSDSDENEEEDKKRNDLIENLEEKISYDAFDYTSHTTLIDTLRSTGDLEKLRQARERMSLTFSLRPELWLVWLQDESNIAISEDEKKNLMKLFERALNDFQSIELWLTYIQYAINNSELMDTEEIRSLFEKSLEVCSQQILNSSKIFSAYLEFEKNILAEINQDSSTENLLKLQKDRIKNIYKKLLILPHNNHEDSWLSWVEWSGNGEDLKSLYQKSCDSFDQIQHFEKKLSSDITGQDRIDIFCEYTNYVLKWENGKLWASALFERALTEICHDPLLWTAYIDMTANIVEIENERFPQVKKLFERSVKSCPWAGPIWTRYIRALASASQPQSDITAVIERALACPLGAPDTVQLWLEYITYFRSTITGDWKEQSIRDKISHLCDRACTSVAQWFGEEGDPECRLLKYFARLELLFCKDFDRFQALWQDIRTIGNHAHNAQSWMEYLSVLRQSDEKPARLCKLYARALERTQDKPELIGEAWLNFERDYGSWKSYAQAAQTIALRLRKIENERRKENVQKVETKPIQTYSKKRKIVHKSELKNKDKRNEESPPAQQALVIPTKRVKLSENNPEPNQKGASDDDPKKTIFLSNLSFSLTELELRTWLKSTGEPQAIRLIKAAKGANKGYAYIVFSTETEAEAALKRDREPLNNRPVFVSRLRSGESGSTQAFRYSTNLEPNKLFVKGLATSTTEETLEKVFSKFGSCKVRLVTFRNGHSKGLAFIEYKDENEAKQALIKMDGEEIDKQIITVQLSQPPVRKVQTNQSSSNNGEASSSINFSKVLGGGRKREGRGSAFLLPRAVTLNVKSHSKD